MDLPELEIENLQEAVSIDLESLRSILLIAHPLCLQQPGTDHPTEIQDEVSCSIVDNREMSRVHGEFLGDPSTTDVITFPYGEIIVCAEVAKLEAGERGLPIEHELALYLIHGLLHLNGFDDRTPEARSRMHARQGEILQASIRNE